MIKKTTHKTNIIALKRIEGQIKGIQKMIESEKYCIDIVNQIHASINGLHRVTEKILLKHIDHCVVGALSGKSEMDKVKKVNELLDVVKKFRKLR